MDISLLTAVKIEITNNSATNIINHILACLGDGHSKTSEFQTSAAMSGIQESPYECG